jgi:uncharacterized membrane protein
MRTREFLTRLDHDRIVSAIREAEAQTAAEIRVYIQRGKLASDPFIAAQRKFHKLSMHKTDHRGSVLIYVAPRAQKFAIVGDEAIHHRCGEALWHRIVEKMRDHFRSERFSDALVDAVREVGELLAEHVPKRRAPD